jgi:hypothetical protein
MKPRILFVTDFPAAAEFGKELAPAGYELIIAEASTNEYDNALSEADFLVGFVDKLVKPDIFAVGTK